MDINLGLDQDLINAVKAIVEGCDCKKEELVGGQKKLDKNGNGKLDADDFKKLRKEEAEELDEISKDTLRSYVGKREDQLTDYAKKNGSPQSKAAMGDKDALSKVNQINSVNQANKNLRKEEAEFTIEDYELEDIEEFMMSEEFQELDEVSGKLLGNYIQKARADMSKKREHAKELDSHPKVAKLDKKIGAWYDKRQYDKRGANIHQDKIRKARSDIETTKKELDPQYPKSVSTHKRSGGIEKAINKLSRGKLTNEQMEEIEALAAKHGLGE